MTSLVEANDSTQEAIELLRHWDFHMNRERVEPLLFTAWLREFSRSILFGRFGDIIADYWDLRPRVVETVLTERQDWCDDPKRPGEEHCRTRLAQALETALARLRHDYGTDLGKWQWERAHVAVFANPVLGRIPVLRDWLEISIPSSGAYDTVNRGPSTIRDDHRPFEHRYGAGLRIITDLASPSDSMTMAVPGQSGNPLSTHFADLLRPWRDFDWLVPGRSIATSALTLVPRNE
jgi:penicillin amidase